MSATNMLEEGFLNHLLRTSTFAKPSTICIGLTGEPLNEDEYSDITGKEIANAGSYARVDLSAPDNATWDTPDQISASGHTENTNDILFTTATASWGWVSGVFISDNATWGTGNILLKGTLITPKLVGNGDQIKFSAGNLDVFVG